MSIENYRIGQFVEFSHQVTQDELLEFAKLSGDDNPIHVDLDYAKKKGNRGLISHGILTAAMISKIIGTRLPGFGSLWLSQEIEFTNAVFPGDQLTARVTVSKIFPKDMQLEIDAEVKNQREQIVLRGRGRVRVPEAAYEKVENRSSNNNRRVLVLGASGALGLEIVKTLSLSNYEVIAVYRNSPDKLESQVTELKKLGKKIHSFQSDLSLRDQRFKLIEKLNSLDLVPTILIMCASLPPQYLGLEQLTSDSLLSSFNLEVIAFHEIIQYVLPTMKKNEFGRVISIGSTASIGKPDKGWSNYSVAKNAAQALVKSAAVEFGPFGITANIVAPGLSKEGMGKDVANRVQILGASETPLGRLVSMNEVASVVEFLASDKSSMITGQTIVIDGGRKI